MSPEKQVVKSVKKNQIIILQLSNSLGKIGNV